MFQRLLYRFQLMPTGMAPSLTCIKRSAPQRTSDGVSGYGSGLPHGKAGTMGITIGASSEVMDSVLPPVFCGREC